MSEANAQEEEKEVKTIPNLSNADSKSFKQDSIRTVSDDKRKRKSVISLKYGDDLSPTTYKKVKSKYYSKQNRARKKGSIFWFLRW